MSRFSVSDAFKRLSVHHWWLESLVDQMQGRIGIEIGSTGFLNLCPFNLRGRSLRSHRHVVGTSGEGKSNLLATLFCGLVEKNIGTALIDPHGDLCVDCLHYLLDSGYFDRSDVAPNPTRKLLYIKFSNPDYFLPWNVLKTGEDCYTTSRNVVKAFKRVYTALEGGFAPVFEDVLFYSSCVLAENHLPITEIRSLLTNKIFREHLLQNVEDTEVTGFFHERFDHWGRDQATMIESTLNKVSALTKVPTLRYTFGQPENTLNFRALMDSGVSCLLNLAGLDEDTQRLLGAFLALGFEQAALTRADTEPKRRRDYHLIMDEFSQFSAQSEQALSRILDLARKYGLFLTMSHQHFSQLSERIQGALQNTQTVSFRLGRTDAVWMAQQFGQYASHAVKHHVADPKAVERVHPLFYTPQETFEEWAVELEKLPIGDCYVKLRSRTEKVRTHRFPRPTSSIRQLWALEESYARQLMVPKEQLVVREREKDKSGAPPVRSQDDEVVAGGTVFTRHRSGQRRYFEK